MENDLARLTEKAILTPLEAVDLYVTKSLYVTISGLEVASCMKSPAKMKGLKKLLLDRLGDAYRQLRKEIEEA